MSSSPNLSNKDDDPSLAPYEKHLESADRPSSDNVYISSLTAADRKALTRRILFKLDILYDMEHDIYISDHQYDTCLVIYYAFYIASEIPSNLVLKKISPKIWFPAS
ncbi:hypothetical protein VF21_09885 [Pseudogymnoascus sp. 05NY08]|nr:hypothetical protein VF21_09885 [Pseudogymnoascus sp. 05NY08]